MEYIPDPKESSSLVLRPNNLASNVLDFDSNSNLPNRELAEGELQEAMNKSASLLREKFAPRLKEIITSLYELSGIDADILSNPEFSFNPKFLKRYNYKTINLLLEGLELSEQVSESLIIKSGNTLGSQGNADWKHYSSWHLTTIKDIQSNKKIELRNSVRGGNSFESFSITLPNQRGRTSYWVNANHFIHGKADEFAKEYNYEVHMTCVEVPLSITRENLFFKVKTNYLPDLNDLTKLTLAPFCGVQIIDERRSKFVASIANYKPELKDTFETYERFRKQGEREQIIEMKDTVTVNGNPEDWFRYFAIYESADEFRVLYLPDPRDSWYQEAVNVGDITILKKVEIDKLDIWEGSVVKV
jgi:hypothetical protein